MGVALELKTDGTFDYWFESDFSIGRTPKFPIQGKWELVKGTLHLDPEDDEAHLYATDWIWIEYESHGGLFSAEDLNVLIWHEDTPDSRMLFKNDQAERWPMMNMPVPGYEGHLFGP